MSEKRICSWCGQPLPPYLNQNRIYHLDCAFEINNERARRFALKRKGIIVEGPLKKGVKTVARSLKTDDLVKMKPRVIKDLPVCEALSHEEAMKRFLEASKNPDVVRNQNLYLRQISENQIRHEFFNRPKPKKVEVDPDDPFGLKQFLPKHHDHKDIPEDKNVPVHVSTRLDANGRAWEVTTRGTGFYRSRV